MRELGFDTLAVTAGYTPDPQQHAQNVPIYMTNAYSFESTEHARRLFALEQPGNIYTRLSNPTCDVLEARMAALDGGVGALSAASGHSAITMLLLNLCAAGDEVVVSRSIYGGAVNLLGKTFAQMGITARFVSADDPESFDRATCERTRAYFFETCGNPFGDIPDLEAISAIAAKHGVPVIADNTVLTPALMRPIEFGADIVVYSLSKYIVGNGTIIGGLVVDSGKFNWKGNERFPAFNLPDSSYHGTVYADLGETAFITKLRTHVLRDVGACLSPFNAWLSLLGLETLSLRMRRHSENALAIAHQLERHPKAERVSYPGLVGSKYHRHAMRYAPGGQSSMFTFDIPGDREAAAKFCDGLEMIPIVTNLGDARTLVSCPAATTHSQLSDGQLAELGIRPGTVRISVGLEDPADIWADIEQALHKI